MFAASFILLTLLSGLLVNRLLPRMQRGSIDTALTVVTAGLIAPSFAGILLLERGSFTPSAIIVVLAAMNTALLLAGLRRPRPERESAHPRPLSRRGVCLAAVILLVGAAVRLPSINFVRGGQDPGVYVNIANSIARTGAIDFADPLAAPLADKSTELGRVYFEKSYRAIACKNPAQCRGAFLPGFYLRSISPSRITPQFYHLHPLWMAFAHLCGGGEYTTSVLFFFGLLSLAVFFLLLREICRSEWAALGGTFILAVSPAYAYFARFPVSEATTSFFFLSALLFIVRSRFSSVPLLVVGALFSGLYFFTHITGFIFLALSYPAFAVAACRARTRRERWAPFIGWTVAASLFAWSFIHGVTFSRPYALSIWEKVGLPDRIVDFSTEQPVLFALILVVSSALPLLGAGLASNSLAQLSRGLLSPRNLARAAVVGLGLFAAFLAYKAYLLGYTDHYAESRWIGKRWHLYGQGLWSIRHMTAAVLTAFVSPMIVLAGLYGVVRLSRRALLAPHETLIFASLVGFALALTGRQLTAPYLYYFGRYLVSTLVPLTIAAAVYGLERIRLRRRAAAVGLRAAVILGAAALLAPYTIAQARSNEGRGLYAELSRLAASLGEKPLLFIDEVNFARVELATPLQISFGVPTYTYSRREHTGKPLYDLMKSASDLGYTVFLLSEKDRRAMFPFLQRVDNFSFTLAALVPKERAMMPTVFRQGRQAATLHRFDPSAPPR